MVLFLLLMMFLLVLAVALVLIVLVQRPQGGGLSGAFGGAGGGGTDTVFGGRVGDALTVATTIIAAAFLLTATLLNLVDSQVTNPDAQRAADAAEATPPGGGVGTDPTTIDPGGTNNP